jgi:hypothetical protein
MTTLPTNQDRVASDLKMNDNIANIANTDDVAGLLPGHLADLRACYLAAGRVHSESGTLVGPTARAYSYGALANNFYFYGKL